MEKSKALVFCADALTDALDVNKPYKEPPQKVFASYWDEWLLKQRGNKEELDDLFLRWLSGKGDRPDIGAGLKRMSDELGDNAAVSSGSLSGAATTVSNLGEIRGERKNVFKQY